MVRDYWPIDELKLTPSSRHVTWIPRSAGHDLDGLALESGRSLGGDHRVLYALHSSSHPSLFGQLWKERSIINQSANIEIPSIPLGRSAGS